MTAHKNVTLSLPEPLLRRFRAYAAARNCSMTALMTEALRKMLDQEGYAERARRRLVERMRNMPDRGLAAKVSWTRDEIHER